MLNEILSHPPLLYGGVFILGLIFGSFFNVVIYRLPLMLFQEYEKNAKDYLSNLEAQNGLSTESEATQTNATPADFNLVFPASACPNCHQPLKSWHNIPLLSYICLKGKCAYCKISISARYPIIELLTACLGIIMVYMFGITSYTFMAIGFAWILLIVTCIDLDHQIIPDDLVIPFLWLTLLYYAFYPTPAAHPEMTLFNAVMGASVGYMSLWSVYIIFKWLTHKEGMGHGDFKLLAMMGAFLGWKMVLLVIIVSSLSGTLVGIMALSWGKQAAGKPIPFGPHLALGGIVGLFWGETLIQMYLELAGLS